MHLNNVCVFLMECFSVDEKDFMFFVSLWTSLLIL